MKHLGALSVINLLCSQKEWGYIIIIMQLGGKKTLYLGEIDSESRLGSPVDNRP